MNRFRMALAVVMAPASLAGQQARPASCAFDTASRQDTLVFEFSMRVFRQDALFPDTALTRGLAAVLRDRLVPPASVGGLLFPFSYDPKTAPELRSVSGGLTFRLESNGAVQGAKWISTTGDTATDAALLAALWTVSGSDDLRDLGAMPHKDLDLRLRVQFLMDEVMSPSRASDSAVAHASYIPLFAPMFRLRAPMIRLDSAARVAATPTTVVPNSTPVSVETYGEVEATVDETGRMLRDGMYITLTRDSKLTADRLLALRYAPATAGGCPVVSRMHMRLSEALIKR